MHERLDISDNVGVQAPGQHGHLGQGLQQNGPLLQAVCEGGGAFYKLLAGGKIVLKMRF
jgi:hypothetical protein